MTAPPMTAFEVLTGDVDGIPTTFAVPTVPEAATPEVRGRSSVAASRPSPACPCGGRRPS